jgi:hypothetical protein
LAVQEIKKNMIKTYKKTFVSLVNVILKEFNLVIRKEGVQFQKYIGEGVNIKFNVTSDELNIFKILKLDYNTFCKGFNSLEEMFAFLTSSPFFKSTLYDKRPKEIKAKLLKHNFELFQKYLQCNKMDKEYTFKRDRTVYYRYVSTIVTDCNIERKVRLYPKLLGKKTVALRKLNGHIVLRYLPDDYKPGPLLGDAIDMYKKRITTITQTPLYEHIIKLPIEDLMDEFKRVTKQILPF